MLNADSFILMHTKPALVKPKKKKAVHVKRKSSRAVGEDIARAVLAAIREEGPISVSGIVGITHYSQNSVRGWIEKINVNDVFTIEKRSCGGQRRNVSYYSVKG